MMQNKRRSGGPDKRLRGINVKSGSKRTLGGGGKRESEKQRVRSWCKQTKQGKVESKSEAVGSGSELLASFCRSRPDKNIMKNFLKNTIGKNNPYVCYTPLTTMGYWCVCLCVCAEMFVCVLTRRHMPCGSPQGIPYIPESPLISY